MNATPPGWYPDPEYSGSSLRPHNRRPQRYWDGTAWTDRVQLPPPIPPATPQSPERSILIVTAIVSVPLVVMILFYLAQR